MLIEESPLLEDRDIPLDNFTLAMHKCSGELSDEEKSILLRLANQMASTNRKIKEATEVKLSKSSAKK